MQLPTTQYTNAFDSSSLGQYGQAVPAAAQSAIANTLLNTDTTGLNAAGSTATSSIFGDLFKNFTGGKDATTGNTTTGWGMPAISLLGGLASFIQGNAAQGIAKDQLKESQRQFDLNYAAQKQSANTELEDRQRARVASSPSAYESVDSYLAKNKL